MNTPQAVEEQAEIAGGIHPFPWSAHNTGDSRGWTVVDAVGATVAFFPNGSPVATFALATHIAVVCTAHDAALAQGNTLFADLVAALRTAVRCMDGAGMYSRGGSDRETFLEVKAVLAKAEGRPA